MATPAPQPCATRFAVDPADIDSSGTATTLLSRFAVAMSD
jgi:hypothetical protein